MPQKYRVAIIGATGKGNYGHGLDTAYAGLERFEVVAVADDNPQGLEAAGKRLGASKLYADYRQMLAAEKPDVVSICPRWITDRVAMVEAVAEVGAHIYLEKPIAGSLVDADALLAACRREKVKAAVAHQFRAMPPVRQALAEVQAGKYGRLIRLHARPKDDHRGGGEELIVHGTHLMDMLIAFAGPPRWVSASLSLAGKPVTRENRREGNEPVGPIAGDGVAATFGFDHGVNGFFDSLADMQRRERDLYGIQIECAEASLYLVSPGDVYVYPAAVPQPQNAQLSPRKIWVQDWHFTPEHQPWDMRDWIARGNKVLVTDLVDAAEQDREPLSSLTYAHQAMEMIQGVYTSHFAGGARQAIPLTERRHPLA